MAAYELNKIVEPGGIFSGIYYIQVGDTSNFTSSYFYVFLVVDGVQRLNSTLT